MITAQMLNAVRGGANKTAIMYKARLSFEQLQRYLKKLSDLGLLYYNNDTRMFTATQKGLLYLGNFTEMQCIEEELDTKRASITRLLSPEGNNEQDSKNKEQDAGGFLVTQLSRKGSNWTR